jgi:ubiquinone biosynthesis protein
MKVFDFIRLFHSILSSRARLNAAEIERMGLLAIKVAQMYAVRADLVDAGKCFELSRLLQNTRPLPDAKFAERWRQLIPAAFENACSSFNTVPLASASLGQVHRATLRDGRQVVVKISRFEQRNDFLADVRRAKLLIRAALKLYPRLEQLADPLGTLGAVERQTLVEMDFRAEKSGADRLAGLAQRSSSELPHLRKLHFPKFFPELSGDGFLVSEFVEGQTLAQWLECGRLPYEALLELFRIHGFFLFAQGEFHGDLHPGNVIWRDGHFWFLDNANVETVPGPFARGLLSMLVFLGQCNYKAAASQLTELSIVPMEARPRRSFISGFNALYRDFSRRSVAERSLTRQMMETVKLAVRHGIRFPAGAFPLIKSLMYLDGMVLRCNPGAVLLRDVARFADDFPAPSRESAHATGACKISTPVSSALSLAE